MRILRFFVVLAALAPALATAQGRPALTSTDLAIDRGLIRSTPAQAAPTAHAEENDCALLNEKWDQFIARDFKISGGSGFSCPSPQASFARAATRLRGLDLEAPFTSIYQWVASSFSQTVFAPAQDREDSLAYSEPQTLLMTIYPAYVELDEIEAISALVHEARHMRLPDPGHLLCPWQLRKGITDIHQGSCERYTGSVHGGAYNTEYVFLSVLAKSPELPAELRATARFKAKSILTNRLLR